MLRMLATSGPARLHIVGQVDKYECSMCIALAEKLVLHEVLRSDGYRSQFKHIPYGEVTTIHLGETGAAAGAASSSAAAAGRNTLLSVLISICAAPAAAGASSSSNVKSR